MSYALLGSTAAVATMLRRTINGKADVALTDAAAVVVVVNAVRNAIPVNT
jgi:hypothetical protein